MKTYLLDILNRYNRFSENLDVKAILCNKSWLAFNDTGDKELYIFQENGSLIVSINGKVANGTWQYISANKSIILSFKGQAYMLHPSFFDKTIFALQQDGTNRYAFMIDEKQGQSFQPKSLTELSAYFKNIERKKVEAEHQRIRVALAQQRVQQKQIEEEQRQQEQYHIEQEKRQREREQEELINRAIEKQRQEERKKEQTILKQHKTFAFAQIIGYIVIIAITMGVTYLAYNSATDGAWLIIPPIIFYLLYFLVYRKIIIWLREKLLRKYLHSQQMENQKLHDEIQWIEQESRREEEELNRLNGTVNYKRMILRTEETSSNYKQTHRIFNGKEFAIYWDATAMKFKNISLLIYNGTEIVRYENLENKGRKIVRLKKVHPPVKIILVANWLDSLIYKVVYAVKG
mgnify:CR=1 FL=1